MKDERIKGNGYDVTVPMIETIDEAIEVFGAGEVVRMLQWSIRMRRRWEEGRKAREASRTESPEFGEPYKWLRED